MPRELMVVAERRTLPKMNAQVSTFSGTQACDIVGITYRQLDYWARTQLVRPAVHEATGSGSRRHYSYRNLLELRVVKSLLDAGIKLESVREVFNYLGQHEQADITSAQGDDLIDVVRRGQGVLNLLPLAQVKDQVDGQLIALYPQLVEPVVTDLRKIG